MAEFHLPSAKEFTTWHESSRPEAVVRLICNEGHIITEWWRTFTGDVHAWGGRRRTKIGHEVPDPTPIIHTQAIREKSDQPYPPVDYWRWEVQCREPGCDYRRVVRHENVERVMTSLLEALLANQVPESQLFEHPSRGIAMEAQADNVFGYLRMR